MPKLVILEPLLMLGLIVAYIWKLRFVHPDSWIAIPVVMLFSHLLRRESPRTLGFEVANLRRGLNELATPLALLALLLLSTGLLFHTYRHIGFDDALLALAAYLPWGLAQEYALNGYFLKRFDAALSGRSSSLFAALLFSAVHAPNPFLMAVTLPLGWSATFIYRRSHNLYVLGIAHAAVGMLLFLMVPDSLSNHLRVGPGWFRP